MTKAKITKTKIWYSDGSVEIQKFKNGLMDVKIKQTKVKKEKK